MKEMAAATLTIEKIIQTPTKQPSINEAKKMLRSCGVLDQKNNIRSAYKDILIDERKICHDNK